MRRRAKEMAPSRLAHSSRRPADARHRRCPRPGRQRRSPTRLHQRPTASAACRAARAARSSPVAIFTYVNTSPATHALGAQPEGRLRWSRAGPRARHGHRVRRRPRGLRHEPARHRPRLPRRHARLGRAASAGRPRHDWRDPRRPRTAREAHPCAAQPAARDPIARPDRHAPGRPPPPRARP